MPVLDMAEADEGTRPGLLTDIRVLDLTTVIMGPYATQILGDLGANVITVESFSGDLNRVMSSGPHPQLSGIALNILRNKRNVALDLKDPAGRTALLRIAATCDVLVTNLRPKSLAHLQLAYEDVARVNPAIIFCQAQGFPTDGERADDPAYDDIIQSASGVASAFDLVAGRPGLAPTIMADKVCGLTIVYSILAALLHRQRGGGGQRIEVPMVDVMSAFMLVEHGAAAIADSGDGQPGYRRILTPNRRPQETRDGWIHILPYTARHYAVIFELGGRPELVGDERCKDLPACIANSDFLYQAVQSVTQLRTTAEWLAICAEHSIPATAIPSLREMVDGLPLADHPVAGQYRTIPLPVRFSADTRVPRRPAPLIGEHTLDVLREVGYSEDELRRFVPTPAGGTATAITQTIGAPER
jgi:crotonobetainyl-CoA:carnitine CoA-transferase CaiB-like acyl-CoA transferase